MLKSCTKTNWLLIKFLKLMLVLQKEINPIIHCIAKYKLDCVRKEERIWKYPIPYSFKDLSRKIWRLLYESINCNDTSNVGPLTTKFQVLGFSGHWNFIEIKDDHFHKLWTKVIKYMDWWTKWGAFQKDKWIYYIIECLILKYLPLKFRTTNLPFKTKWEIIIII